MSAIVDGNGLLAEGLEDILNPGKFSDAFKKVCDEAFAAIFRAQDEGKLKWKREGTGSFQLRTSAKVKNGKGKEITVPVFLYMVESFAEDGSGAYLTIGNDRGSPCRNQYDHRVLRMYEQITGDSWPGAV